MRIFLLLIVFCSAAHAAQVRGKVLAPDGAPVVGATVWAGEFGRSDYATDNGTIQRLTTDAAGAFMLDIADKPNEKTKALVRVQSEKLAPQDTILKAGDNTIKLSQPKTVRGIVKDGKGAPVEGAVVDLIFAPSSEKIFESELEAGDGPLSFLSLMFWASALPPIETRSGANGEWSLAAAGMAIVTLKDARFANVSGMSGIPGAPGGEFITLVAKPGATLQGKILTPDGKPVPGVFIMGGGEMFGAPQRTDANGAFTVTGMMPAPATTLIGFSPNGDWVIPPLQIKTPLEPGKVNEALEWKASRGIEITGIVVDKKTGAPLAGAQVGSILSLPSTTGADGRFKTRATPGQVFLMVRHPDYAQSFKNFDKIGNEATFDAGKIALDRALTLTGRLLDDKGAPVPDVMIVATSVGEMPTAQADTTKADGTFTMKVGGGSVNVNLQTEGWELQPKSNVKVELNEKTAPLELKARKLPTLKATGRVVTPGGAPVAGVTVSVQIERAVTGDENAMTGTVKNADTDAQGNFTVEFYGIPKTVKVTKVEGSDYLLRKAGEGKLKDGAWALADSVAAALTGQVSGRVLDANGAPIAGALIVSPEAAKFEPVKTDAEGHFTLQKLPEGEAVLLAAAGKNAARQKVQTGAEAVVKILPSGNFVAPMRRQFFEQSLKSGSSEISNYWDFIGSDKLLALALQKDGALPPAEMDVTKADWSKAGVAVLYLLQQSAAHDTAWLLQNGAALLEKIPADKNRDERFDAQAALAAVAALKGDEAARAWANQWLDKAKLQKDAPNDNVKNANRLFQLAGIAGALNRPEADGMVVAALTLADQAGKTAIIENAPSWGASLGMGGVALFAPLDGEWAYEARFHAVQGALQKLAKIDFARSQPFFEKLKTLRDEPAPKEKPEPFREKAKQEFEQTERQWRLAQAQSDPEAAWKWAEATPNIKYDWQMRGAIARGALRLQKPDVARRVMDLAEEQNVAPASVLSYFAVLAARFDRALSEKLLAQAATRAAAPENYDYNSADYGYYLAATDPARARLFLEEEWQRALTPSEQGGEWMMTSRKARTAGAMIALEPLHALELLGEVSDGYQKNQARARIMAYLLSNEADRAALRADNE